MVLITLDNTEKGVSVLKAVLESFNHPDYHGIGQKFLLAPIFLKIDNKLNHRFLRTKLLVAGDKEDFVKQLPEKPNSEIMFKSPKTFVTETYLPKIYMII